MAEGEYIFNTGIQIKSSLRPNNTHLDIAVEDPTRGRASMFFVNNKQTGPKGEIVLSSGFIQAVPTGKGLGADLIDEVGATLQTLANKSKKTIIHPLYPSSEDSKRFFQRHEYLADTEEIWKKKDIDQEYWHFRMFNPADEDTSSDKSNEVVLQFELLRPDIKNSS